MTAFEQHGYLADEDGGFKDHLKEIHGDYISICMKLNEYAQKLQGNLVIHERYIPEVVSAVLFIGVINTFQAAMILSYKGMHYQMDMLIRCVLDYSYRLAAISKDPLFAKELVDEAPSLKLSRCNKFLAFYKNAENVKMIDLFEKEIARIKDGLPKNEKGNTITTKISSFYCAQKAGMEDDYNTLYAEKCDTVHASIYAIEDTLLFEGDTGKEKIDAISNLPDVAEIGKNYYILAKILASAVECVCKVFGYGVSDDIEKWIAELDGIARRKITEDPVTN